MLQHGRWVWVLAGARSKTLSRSWPSSWLRSLRDPAWTASSVSSRTESTGNEPNQLLPAGLIAFACPPPKSAFVFCAAGESCCGWVTEWVRLVGCVLCRLTADATDTLARVVGLPSGEGALSQCCVLRMLVALCSLCTEIVAASAAEFCVISQNHPRLHSDKQSTL